MKKYIRHNLFTLNDADENHMIECMGLLFEWANSRGLDGQKVRSLVVTDPLIDKPLNPFNRKKIYCFIEVNDEE